MQQARLSFSATVRVTLDSIRSSSSQRRSELRLRPSHCIDTIDDPLEALVKAFFGRDGKEEAYTQGHRPARLCYNLDT